MWWLRNPYHAVLYCRNFFHASSYLLLFLTSIFSLIIQGFFVVLSWMPIYFNSVRLIIFSFVIANCQAIQIFRNKHINHVLLIFRYRYIMWISDAQHGLVLFRGLWWLSWIFLLACGQIWWYRVVQVSLWLVRLCRYVAILDKKLELDVTFSISVRFNFIPWCRGIVKLSVGNFFV